MTHLAKCINYMMPDRLFCEKEFYKRKAQTLASLHLVFIFYALVHVVLSNVVSEPPLVPTFLPFTLSIILAVVLKKIGNLKLSGNLLCLVYFAMLAVATQFSGGIYSDDIIWLGVTPVFAFLFVSKRMGFYWYLAFAACVIYFYNLDINTDIPFRETANSFSSSYLSISWLLLFMVLSSIVYICSTSESVLIDSLLKNEQKLIAQREELRMQTENLKQKEQQLLKLNDSLEHYAYAISHDLKEPLRTVKSYTQLLNRSLGNDLNENNEIYMNFILSGTDRMGHLLDDLLEFSRISEVNQVFVPVNLNDVILLVVNNLNRIVQETHTSIEVEDNLPLVNGTQSLLVIVMQNLISNAIKFRHVERNPIVKVYHRQEKDCVVICVEDNGIGIAKDYKEKVFEIFNRLHTREKYDGSGIGLTTCGKIITSLGGKICLESELGKGTTVVFSIPNRIAKQSNQQQELTMLEQN